MTSDTIRDVWEVPDNAIMPAVWFWDLGVYVFPTVNKVPAVPKGTSQFDYRCSRDQAARFREYGVPLSDRLGVLDTDDRDDEYWVLKQIADRAISDTPFVVTTARGFHRYYRLAGALPKFLHRDGHTIEFRNEGQYVVGPGSVRSDGVTYRASSWSWRLEDIPYFSADFLFDDGSCGVGTTMPGLPYEIPEAAVSAGQRHYELFRFVRHCKSLVDDKQQARNYVSWFNQQRCRPPLTEDHAFERWFDRAWHQRDRPFAADPFAVNLEAF